MYTSGFHVLRTRIRPEIDVPRQVRDGGRDRAWLQGRVAYMALYHSDQILPRHAALGGGQFRLSGMKDVTVLLGKNGCGKSVLLRSWRDKDLDACHYVVPERTGEMDFQPQFMQHEMTGRARREGSARNFVPEYRRRIISRVQTYFMHRGNYRGERPAVGSPEEIEGFLHLLIPDFAVELVVGSPPYVLTRLATGEKIMNVDQLSSGEAQLLTLGLDALTVAAIWRMEQRPTRVLLLDEPDAHIHPDLQARFADFLLRIVDHFAVQVVVATHSTSLLAALVQFGRGRTSVAYMSRNEPDVAAREFDAVMREAAACLGGHVLMGHVFGAPLLLVEGDDDYRIWSQVPRHHVVQLAALPSNGEEIFRYQQALERMFASLRESYQGPVGFALLDGDKGVPERTPHNPQDHIRFLQLACLESENLYVTDSVLKELGCASWDDAAARIVARAPDFGNKATELAQAATWDRRRVELKRLIDEVARILDPKNLPWSVRVGKTIGQRKPEGELADFLGPDVMRAFWGA